MKKRTTFKNLSMILAIIMLMIAVFPNYAYAAEAIPSDAATDIDLYSMLDDEDLSINADVATCIAKLFVSDMINSGTTVWDETTKPVNTVTMYDETGETATAYSVELTQGYVVVSAYIDVPDIILEWADEATPYYSNSTAASALQGSNQETKIIYLGALSYYIDNGSDKLETVLGEQVERTVLDCSLDNTRNGEYVSSEMCSMLLDAKQNLYGNNEIQPLNNHKGEVIDNVDQYAKNVYGAGTWTCHDYANHWENWIGNCTYTMVNDTTDTACCPISITNQIVMYNQRKDSRKYDKNEYKKIYDKVSNLYMVWPLVKYYDGSAVGLNAAKDYVKKAFKEVANKTIKISSHDRFTNEDGTTEIHITPIIETCKDKNHLMLIYLEQLQGHGYGNHYVVGYAYNRLQNPNVTAMRSFVKIRDCITEGPRYLDVYALGSNCWYYDIDLS